MKTISLFLLFFLTIPLSAVGKTFFISGFVADAATKEHLPFVNVALLRPDSTVVNTAVSTNGFDNQAVRSDIQLKTDKVGKYIIRCSYMGYETTYVDVEVKLRPRTNTTHIGTIYMKGKTEQLKEVNVMATRIKMVMKKDTIVYNASAFNLAEGSMLDALVNQLPGAELKEDGRIFVNGRFVENLMLNGKDFFSGDPKVALENLPSYMIDKVKVYNKAREKDQMRGGNIHDKQFVMDVHLKKQYSIGWIANAEAGVGSSDRYMGKFFALRFTQNSRLSIFGNINNLNDNRTPGRNGEWTPQSMPDGLLSSKVGGIDFRLDSNDDNPVDLSTSNRIERKDADNQVSSSDVTFLSGGNAYSRSFNASRNQSTKFTTKNYIDFAGIGIQPYLEYETYNNNRLSLLGNFSADPSMYVDGNVLDSLFTPTLPASLRKVTVNRRKQLAQGEGHRLYTKTEMSTRIVTNKETGDAFYLKGNIGYSSAQNKAFGQSLLDYPADAEQQTDFRNQYYNTPSNSFNYDLKSEYYYNLTSNLSLGLFYKYSQSYRSATNSLYRLDKLPGWGEDSDYPIGALPSTTEALQRSIDERNSYSSNRHNYQHSQGAQVSIDKRDEQVGQQLIVVLKLPINVNIANLNYNRNATYYPLKKKYTFFEPDLYFSRETNGFKRAYRLNYNLSSSTPEMTYLLDIRDDSNPLNISRGNLNLKSTHTHTASFSYDDNKPEHEQNFKIGANYWLAQNAVAMGFLYDRKMGVRTTTPTNVSGNWNGSVYVSFGRALDKKHRWSFSNHTSVYYGNSVDMVGVEGVDTSQRSSVGNLYLTENLRLDYRLGSFQIGAKARGNLTHATSKRTDFTTINAADFNYGLTGQVELPWQMQLSTDLTIYSRRGYSLESMNTDDLVWNARLAKRCMKGNLTFILDGFDILGNLSNVRQYVNAQGRSEYHYNVIPSYAMLHAVYRLNLQPKKKK